MEKYLYIIIAIIGGIAGGLQAPINGALGKRIGGFEGAFVSFVIGTLFLFFVFLFFGKGNVLQMFHVPKWQLLGGLVGAVLVTAIILAVPNLGVAATIFSVIMGQIAISLIIDHFGLFGVQHIPFNWERILGVVLMIGGLLLIFRSSMLN
jgi:bacterial/archaeal transporter family-2 protein